jgi:diaminopimelate decarboxylase
MRRDRRRASPRRPRPLGGASCRAPVELVGAARAPRTARPALVAGPTCFEDDVLGDWLVGSDHLAIGARLVLRGVTGYAVAWNTGFAGIAPAEVAIA